MTTAGTMCRRQAHVPHDSEVGAKISCFVKGVFGVLQWIWIAMDARIRQVMACHRGKRRRDRAQELWAALPLVYREQATFPTKHYAAYTGVMPAERHTRVRYRLNTNSTIERAPPIILESVTLPIAVIK